MPIIVTCPSCGHKTKAPDNAAGKTGKCPHCKSPVLVPTPSAAAPPQRGGPDIGLVESEVIDAEVIDATPLPPPPPRPRPAAVPPPKRYQPEPDEPIGLADASLSAANNPPPSDDDNRRPCPACGEMIPDNALKCRFCGETTDPELKKQEARKKRRAAGIRSDDEQMTAGDWVVAILCSFIGCIVGIVWIIQGKPKGKWMLLVSFCVDILKSIVWAVIQAANGEFNSP